MGQFITIKSAVSNTFFIGLITLLLSISKGDNNKLWDANSKLTWSDFKDTTLNNSRRAALTASGIILNADPVDASHYTAEVYCIMDRNKSWVDVNRKSDYILSHEQYHFNITEYWCRKIKKDIAATHFTAKNIREKLESIRREDFKNAHEMEIQYDDETKHSLVKDQQQKWEKRIDALLKETEKYAGPTITISLK